jgi:endonuclease G
MSLEKKLARLKAYNSTLRKEGEVDEEALEVALPPDRALALESIVMRKRRPVLAVQDGAATLEFQDPRDGELWMPVLERAKPKLEPVISAVGRIDLQRNADYRWVGTGWLLHANVLVTNRHVAQVFSSYDGEAFVFQPGVGGDMGAEIDFLQEIGRDAKRLFKVKSVLYIEPRPGLDLAFLEVDQAEGGLAKPIELSSRAPRAVPEVATIGYPAFDSRIPEPDLMEEIYGNTYDKKRLAPGAITDVDDTTIHHNCTTLGGNSGSVIVDLSTGEALGLHFSGSFMRTNYAVRADLLQERLDGLLRGTLRPSRERARSTGRSPSRGSASTGARSTQSVARIEVGGADGGAGGTRVINIPLVVSISLGEPSLPAPAASPRPRPARATTRSSPEREDDVETEATAKAADYADRAGYEAEFLGEDFVVDLPEVVKAKADVLTFGDGGQVLDYEHFSVVYNERRRMCFFSACNINGARSKSSKRTPWRYDPRIPKELQIMKECYGSSPKFSRGHMTRREDPAWGTPRSIQRGADDSMHVTNVAPQMQSFNAPIWLALEDYALQHAREDSMSVSVFTGPYFTKNDPTMYGVRIPLKFWKVIAFIHDETGELCATGYEMSQQNNLEEEEFVFGQFRSPQLNTLTQVALSTIESRAGLSFHGLTDFDPFGQEGIEEAPGVLTHFEHIRFL